MFYNHGIGLAINKKFLIFPLFVFLTCVILPHSAYSIPGVVLTPTTSAIGKAVTITGTGFAASSIVTISFDGIAQTTTSSPVTTDTTGAFTATFTVPPSTAGPHTVTAMDASANSASVTLTVTLRATTTTVTPNPAGAAIGAPVTFHAKVLDSSSGTKSIPTGTISWSDGGAGGSFNATSCTLSQYRTSTSTGICNIVYTPPVNAGPVTITATYSGDSTHKTSSGTSALTVSLRGTTTVVTPNPATGTIGVSMTFKAKIADISGGTKTIPSGTVSWSDGGVGGSFAMTFVQGKIGQALSFDGTAIDRILNSSTLNFGVGSFSISTWVKTNQTIIGWIVEHRPNNDGVYAGYSLEGSAQGVLLGRIRDSSAHDVTVSTGPINDNQFHHVLYVVDRSIQTSKMYVDGNLVSSADISSVGNIDQNSIGVDIGYTSSPNTPNGPFVGQVDQTRIYNSALSSSDVQSLFTETSSSSVPTSGLVGEWKFDGNTLDTSGAGNNGIGAASSCTLVTATASSSTCSIKYNPPANAGPVTIIGTYSGDSTHKTSSGTSALTVSLRATSTFVTPNPATTGVGTTITFKAKIADISGGTKTIPSGTVSWSDGGVGGSFAMTFVQGKIGQALSFDGTAIDRILNSSTLNFGVGSFSISTWVKTNQTIIGWIVEHRPNNDGVYAGYSLEGSAQGVLLGRIRDSSAHDVTVSTGPINDNQFHHVLYVVDRSIQTSKMYVDGNLVSSADISSVGNIDQNSIGVDIGYTSSPNTPNGPFVGQVDQTRIYNSALSSSDVQSLFTETSSSSVPTSGLVGEWKFDGNTLDTSGAGNNGIGAASSCTLVTATASSSTCSIKYNPPANAGPVTITATYSGDGTHKTSSGTSALTVS